jgi:hypothetical protein
MKNFVYLLTVALLSCSFAYCDQESEFTKQIKSQYHRVYIGPDVFIDYIQQKNADREIVNVKSKTVFGGLKVGYDYLKPQAFYFGTDGLISIGKGFYKERRTYPSDYYIFRFRENLQFKTTSLFANLEQRYGYTFQNLISSKSTLIPFAGIGWYYSKFQFDNNLSFVNWFYGAAGLRVTQQFCENFDVGFNLKAMYAFAGRSHTKWWFATTTENIRNAWGYEVAMPFTWHVGESKKWDLQFQPYFLKLNVNNQYQILGARLLAGYSF